MAVMSSPEEYNLTDFENENGNVIVENSDSNSYHSSDSLYSSGDSIGISFHTSQIGSFRSEIITDSDDNDEQISENGRNWMELPSPAIENIYTFLSRTDQSRMSLVCSRWSKHFNSPCLWKTFRFYLPEHNYSSDIYPEVRFARKYASMIRHVEIICKRVKNHLIEDISNQLKLFLQAMEFSSHLISIKLINMGNYFRRLEDVEYECLFVYFIRLFYSQENLKTVVFQESRFSKEKGMELLKAIFHSDSHTIRTSPWLETSPFPKY
ncbi:hypothetical protein HNY73_008305 [Argiope bruennichi]|uniref:F-box domain-containing protein n=1 Tax=Argiope bruennichi TaxID=94029 RepID=A0A8T0F5Y9_ARGBR|nr:hypothetical protein HNY73_008305 [Argiope bruennichi]